MSRDDRTPSGRFVGVLPDKVAVVDAGLLLLCGAIAVLGLHETFTGWSYFTAAAVGLVLGIAIAHLTSALGQPVIVLAVLTVAAYFLLGGAVALHGSGVSGMVPLPGTLAQLADQSVNGWKELLTTLPPVDGGPLLTLPYILGLVTGAAGMAAARRTRSALLPALAPVALLATVILLGVQRPRDLQLLGVCFAVATLGWVILRARRQRFTATARAGVRWRSLTAVGLVAVAASVAMVLGPHLPGLGDERVVLRSFVTPPFDVGQYPSPLASFRKYTRGYQAAPANKLFDKPILTVQGVPAGTRVRFATLDHYDGTVWGASDDAGLEPGSADTFQKVGSVIAGGRTGESDTVRGRIEVEEGYTGVWLPTVGALTRIDFESERLGEVAGNFRYNLATGTGVLPDGVRPGDAYSFEAVVEDSALQPGAVPWNEPLPGAEEGARFQQVAAEWAGSAGDPVEQVLAIAEHLRSEGRYTDGEAGNEEFLPGHSLGRLTTFAAQGRQIAGNDEQYAAMMALLANQMSVPARVVMGATVPEDGVVHGRDVQAWVEVRAADGSWRTLTTEQFMSEETPPDDEAPQPEEQVTGKVIPPPAPVRPPSTAGDPVSETLNQKADQGDDQPDTALPGWVVVLLKYVVPPLLLVLLGCAAIVLVKAVRRSRRRTRGTPAHRLASAWRELVDQARDLGHVVHPRQTRREQATTIGADGLTMLARRADAHVFGVAEPDDQAAAAYWGQVDGMRRQLTRSLTLRQRARAALSLRSLRDPARLEVRS